jgi:predicted RNA-binding protein with PIN domain
MIDGHNLIPKIGLSLDASDDEQSLIDLLIIFARRSRSQVDVYFDGAPPGELSVRRFGKVTAHFVRVGATADAAIEARLSALKKAAHNWTVVSSDHEVQAAAGRAGAKVVSSQDFAQAVHAQARTRDSGKRKVQKPGERKLGKAEIDEWLRLFKDR